MEQYFHMNKETDETQKLRLQEQKNIGNKYQNVLPKMNSNLQIKKYKGNDINLIINNKTDQQQKSCRKSNSSVLNKITVSTKNMLHSNNNNSLVKQKRKESKNLHKSVDRLHDKVLSDSNFLCESKMQTKFKNQGIQTLDTKEMNSLYSEGTIRYMI